MALRHFMINRKQVYSQKRPETTTISFMSNLNNAKHVNNGPGAAWGELQIK